MKTKMRRLFSLFEKEAEYFNDGTDKIELVNGNLENRKCTEYLFIVNNTFRELEKFRHNKDYFNSIETLKKAYHKTFELKEPSCLKFANFLRSTIINTIENIHWELEKMSSGIFKTTRYEKIRHEAGRFLNECRKHNSNHVIYQRNKLQEELCEDNFDIPLRKVSVL